MSAAVVALRQTMVVLTVLAVLWTLFQSPVTSLAQTCPDAAGLVFNCSAPITGMVIWPDNKVAANTKLVIRPQGATFNCDAWGCAYGTGNDTPYITVRTDSSGQYSVAACPGDFLMIWLEVRHPMWTTSTDPGCEFLLDGFANLPTDAPPYAGFNGLKVSPGTWPIWTVPRHAVPKTSVGPPQDASIVNSSR